MAVDGDRGEKVEKERKESGLLGNISIVWPRWVRTLWITLPVTDSVCAYHEAGIAK